MASGLSGGSFGIVLDSEESKNIAVVHKTNQGYSGKDLWKLKQEKPELFGTGGAPTGSGGASQISAPPGFGPAPDLPRGSGWLFSRAEGVYLNSETRKRYFRDPNTGELAELSRGQDITSTLTYRGDAATCVGEAGLASRNVIISDLHRAAASMKLDFAHHDAPAAMFAVYDGRSAAGGAAAEAAAKGLHVRLLPRLAGFRGIWTNDKLEAVVSETIEHLAREVSPEGAGVALALALLLGGRVTIAATCGAFCMMLPAGGEGSIDNLEVFGQGQKPNTECVILEDSHLGVFLTVDGVRSATGMSPARLRSLVRAHVSSERPKAACITVLEEARKNGAETPLAAAAVRFNWHNQDADAPSSKKQRVEALTKVRCRHILVRHTGSVQAVGERPRAAPGQKGKPGNRTLREAESQLLGMLPELAAAAAGGSVTAFTNKVKGLSECDTALRGGDLAGDLGWLDKDPKKNKRVPAQVVHAAFSIAVGQLSDIVSSERGVHLILRTA